MGQSLHILVGAGVGAWILAASFLGPGAALSFPQIVTLSGLGLCLVVVQDPPINP